MALDLVGKWSGRDILDIHAGGVDLIFPHHEDEIAQSCAHTGQADFARVWMHGEFLTMSGTKMSKRFGNILTARDLREEHVDAATVRTLFGMTHYRQKLDFTDEALAAAREGSRRLGEFDGRMAQSPLGDDSEFDQLAVVLKDEFDAAMDDDLNTPRALAALFEAVRAGNRLLDRGERPTAGFRSVWQRLTSVLQVLPANAKVDVAMEAAAESSWTERLPDDPAQQISWANWWAAQRLAARQSRDFAESDRIRALLDQHGWEVRDNRDGTATVQRK
jgi:cysteinyl-tRNA synthetase